MSQPDYVRGALFTSHAHYWELQSCRVYMGEFEAERVRSAIVWRKRRRYARPA